MTLWKGHTSRRALLGAAGAVALGPARAQPGGPPIRIGFGMSLTGGLASGGRMCQLAMEIWREEVNARGGLLGRPVEFVSYNDQSNPSLVPALYAKLIDVDRVNLLVSPFGTNQIAPAMPVIMQRNRLFMALFGTGVNDEFRYDRYFQILPNGPESKRSLSRGFFEAAVRMQPRPQTVALIGADAEFSQNVLQGARANAEELGLRIIYDRGYPPTTVDFAPVLRAIRAHAPEVVFVASYPPDSAGLVRAMNEMGYAPRLFGGAMIGLSFATTKAQFGSLLNGIVTNDNYVPEPTMRFPGAEAFIARYQERAAAAGADPLGYFLAPFAYAAMQVLAQAVTVTGSLDEARLALQLRQTRFETIIGEVRFGPLGEWERSRILTTQFQGIQGNDLEQFKRPGRQVILWPPELASGTLIHPLAAARGRP